MPRVLPDEEDHDRRNAPLPTSPLFIEQSLSNHVLGLAEIDDGICSIFFSTVSWTKLDKRDYIIRGQSVLKC